MSILPIEIMVKLTYNVYGVIKMAEFCLECFNKVFETNEKESAYILSKDLDLCDYCGEFKRVVVRKRTMMEVLNYNLITRFFKKSKQ